MASTEEPQGASLVSHLIELRSRLLKILAATGIVFIALLPFANALFDYVSAPLRAMLPIESAGMIAIDVASPFLTPLKLSFLAAVLIALPYLFYQVWAFVAPGLYRRERRLVFPLVVSSTLLFYTGMIFAYFVVFPLMFKFFVAVAPEGVAVMTDIHRYLNFIIKIFIAFGIAFEMPIATLLLVRTGTVTPQDLSRNRPYIIIGSFVLGMLLTPPDVFSQVLLALPLWGLFELGLWLSRLMPALPLEDGHGNGKTDTKTL